MDNIARLLDSMSEDDLRELQDTAKAMFGDAPAQKAADAPQMPDAATMQKISRVLGKMQHGQDDRTALIAALTPYLSAARQKRAQEAMQFLRLMDVLPLLQDFGKEP